MAVNKISSNQVPQPKPDKGNWTGVNGRIWRHTIGRASNLVRIPLNLLASIIQGFKIVGKTAALPVTYSVVKIHSLFKKNDETYIGSMSLRGIAIDGIGFLRLLQNVKVCSENLIFAPKVNSVGLKKGLKGTWVILSGDLHNQEKYSPVIFTVSRIYDMTIKGKKKAPTEQHVPIAAKTRIHQRPRQH